MVLISKRPQRSLCKEGHVFRGCEPALPPIGLVDFALQQLLPVQGHACQHMKQVYVQMTALSSGKYVSVLSDASQRCRCKEWISKHYNIFWLRFKLIFYVVKFQSSPGRIWQESQWELMKQTWLTCTASTPRARYRHQLNFVFQVLVHKPEIDFCFSTWVTAPVGDRWADLQDRGKIPRFLIY